MSPSTPPSAAPSTPAASLIDHHGLPALRIRAGDGAQATVLLHGAQLVSWIPAGGVEQLFVSPLARFAPGQALRGGVPVIFPQFEQRGPLPRHGFARNRAWQAVQRSQLPGHAMAVLRLTDDEATRAIWPQAFVCELTVGIGGQRLDVELAVTHAGPEGAEPMRFTAALHTYLRIGELRQVRLEGLRGSRYEDSARGGRKDVEVETELRIEEEVDRIYLGAGRQTLLLREPGRRLGISADGFADVVVWNPGAEKAAALPDLGPDAWRQMLCVEAAQIGQPVELAAGEEWVGRQSLVAG
ncbi:MAG: D-hexose-6-phosphate mutarotase [Aquabacterium sp.]|nr:D-hexose-6-phosphate mutarotase [Aquabacterium sp.]